MGNQPPIGPRERQILTAVVETYISTGEPVASRTLSRISHDQLSAATIRNVMAELADCGYLDQPHTSAGRVPTSAAFRFYVDQLTGKGTLSPQKAEEITEAFRGVTDPQEFMERTSHVLSLISSNVGVAMSLSGFKNTLEHVYFSRLAANKILAVVVTTGGVVRDRLLRTAGDLSQDDLEKAARFINENFRGFSIEAVQQELRRRIEQERNEYDRLMHSLEELYRQGALDHPNEGQTVYVEGAANLVAGEKDKQRLHQMLRTLEEKQKVAELLSAYLDTRQEAVRVVIGLGDRAPEMNNMVLIGAPARVGHEMRGSLAVIGPTRMDYQHAITAVQYIADLFDKILNEPK